jgi:hypothetical protein
LHLEPAQAQEPVALRRDLERPGHLFGGHLLERLALGFGLRLRLGFTPALRLGFGLRLGSHRLAGSKAGLYLVDELLPAQQPEARHPELRCELMKGGQMELCELFRHRGRQDIPHHSGGVLVSDCAAAGFGRDRGGRLSRTYRDFVASPSELAARGGGALGD